MKIGVIGSGTWGMALSLLLNDNGHQVRLWSAIPTEVEALNTKKEHPNLPGVPIPDAIEITGDLESSIRGMDLLVLSVPSIFTRSTARKMKPYVEAGQIIVSVAKGIEEDTLKTLSEQIEEEIPQADVCVLSGPSHAEEVGRRIPTTCVVGAKSRKTAEFVQKIFMNPVFRVYTSPDIIGIELGGSIKNVIALAAGIADGIGYGDNTKAALITRGLAEMTRLAVKMGGRAETLSGLSGMGDLIVTCASMHSRNRRAGILIGQGKSMKEAMDEVHMVVEGVYSAKAALALSKKYQVSMPIVEKVNEMLFEGKNAVEAVDELMRRESRVENSLLPWPEDEKH
ncbi:MAG: NAD(P)H-dependent glycerol-3-phosphate dehydrogenase [Lachnospiraceae bacterium]|nr:NAD(P)H-dependent glycerol-3-phosphate dehydrogenase [Lachnospiraceae bacterium]